MQIIGLSGYARSGKDETAKVLVEEFGFKRVAFADKLRDVIYALNPIVAFKVYPPDDYMPRGYNPHTVVHLQDVIDVYSWDKYKESEYGPEIRRLLQRLGTEAGRQTLWDSIWIDAALTGFSEDDRIVVTDCRFPNEAQAILDRGGKVVRIERKGVGPANSHASETSLDDWDFNYKLDNRGTLTEFTEKVREFHDYLGTEAYFEKVLGM